jgi:hypothetical protein
LVTGAQQRLSKSNCKIKLKFDLGFRNQAAEGGDDGASADVVLFTVD